MFRLPHMSCCSDRLTVSEGNIAGLTGAGLRLEAFKVNMKGFDGKACVKYQAHVEDIGWQAEKTSGQVAGTTGQGKRIEAIKISLTAPMSEFFDIYYRVHVQNIGWMGWARNDEMAGTAGYAYRLEGIEIRLVEKGSEFPDYGKALAFRERK